MGKTILAALVGALILFIWQFLSWTQLNVHKEEMMYTPNQDKIIQALGDNLTEDGIYFVPNVKPGATAEDHEQLHMDIKGQPWAQIRYHTAYEMNMGMNMFRAFFANLLAMLFLIWILTKIPAIDFKTAFLSSLAIGIIGYLTFPYLNSIWFDSDTIGYVVDTIVQWGLVGVWLGWILPRNRVTT